MFFVLSIFLHTSSISPELLQALACSFACIAFLRNINLHAFFCLTPPPYTQFRDMGVRPAPPGASRLRGKDVVFFK